MLHRDYDVVRQHGLTVESPEGNFVLPRVYAYHNADKMPPCDVVIVALKTTQNHLLPELLPPVLDKNGVVLLLQNGLGIEAEVAQIVGRDRILSGLCFICSNKVGAGHIRHLDYGKVTLGDYDDDLQPKGITTRMSQIAEDFATAHLAAELEPDLLLVRWRKLLWNVPFNSLSVVLNATTAEMMADAGIRQLAQALMQETLTTANTQAEQVTPQRDRALSADLIDKMLTMTAKMEPYRTSMKIDYDQQRPLEVEAILGNPLRIAQRLSVPTPHMTTLYQQLKFLDARNRP